MIHKIFGLNRLYTLGAEYSVLSSAGVASILEQIEQDTGHNTEYETSWFHTYIGTSDSPKGLAIPHFRQTPFAGTLVQRIRKWYEWIARNSEDEVNEFDESKYTSIIAAHMLPGNMFFDITADIDWRSGEFGEKSDDRGSCWWSIGFPSSISIFNENPPEYMCALRLFKPSSKGKRYYPNRPPLVGAGRCWIFQDPAWGQGFVMANAYGLNLPLLTEMIVKKLRKKTGDNTWAALPGDFQISAESSRGSINNNTGWFVSSLSAPMKKSRVNDKDWFFKKICPNCGTRSISDSRCLVCSSAPFTYVNGQRVIALYTYLKEEDDELLLKRLD